MGRVCLLAALAAIACLVVRVWNVRHKRRGISMGIQGGSSGIAVWPVEQYLQIAFAPCWRRLVSEPVHVRACSIRWAT